MSPPSLSSARFDTGWDVIVCGAGASGLMAAGRAAERGLRVLLLEKTSRAASKILVSGNGRCNITNAAAMDDFIGAFGKNGRFLHSAFHRFFRDDLLALLRRFGVRTKVEEDGRIFPVSDKAQEIARALQSYASKSNVHTQYLNPICGIILEDGRVAGVKTFGGIYRARNVVMACGGKSYPALGTTGDGYEILRRLGHDVVPLYPALASLLSDGTRCRTLEGLALRDIVIRAHKASERGDAVFTAGGVSGPAALNLSRAVFDKTGAVCVAEICIDLFPDETVEGIERFLNGLMAKSPRRKIANLLKEMAPGRMVLDVLSAIGISPDAHAANLNKQTFSALARRLKNHRFPLQGTGGFREAMTTGGGTALKEVDSRTMRSKLIGGLYITGELLDIAGATGGFNLQAACSTGWVAGDSVKI